MELAGYHAQVHVEPKTSLVFLLDGQRRATLRRQNGDYVAKDLKYSGAERMDRAEQLSPNALLRRGLRKTDFPAGTEVVIEGYRAKNGTATLNGRSVKLPDGRNLFTGGSAPDEQPQP